ncbi:TonB-dependent receptor [Psychrobacter sp. I-STPA6b]|uniref:TonB-dependent receptor n=1 Tax=Psychrobacter sp. I-STPA6b TaxID=2585718 RepID=UPI001D0CA2BD|nr:TonB-dependent receptor [Psychrobacter sp. I-STPA6b]
MKSYQTLTLSLLSLCVTQQLYAETTQQPTVTLDPVIISAQAKTGTALAQKISEMPAVTQIISQDEIALQATGNRSLAEILGQLIPSLGTASGSTSNYGTTMHGRPVQYLLNGVPLTGSRNISRQLNSIDPTQLERVEVLSGATSIYGSGATGGLINLVTKSTANYGVHGQTRVGVSSNQDFNKEALGYNVGQTLEYGSENGVVDARLDVDYEVKGGQFDSMGNRISPDVFQTDQQDTNTLSVNANLGWQINDTQRLNLAATHYDNQQDTDYGPDYGPGLQVLLDPTATPSLKAIDGAKITNQPYTTKNTVNLNYHHDNIAGSKLNITGYYRDETGRFYPSGQSVGKQAAPYITKALIGAGVTDPAVLKPTVRNLAQKAVAIAQSEADIKVLGVRAAMQTETQLGNVPTLFSYGLDYDTEKDKQYYYGQDLNKFIQSNGLVAEPNGNKYFGGPNTTIDKAGVFANVDMDVTDSWHVGAGIRYQNIKANTEAFTPITEALLEEFFNNLRLQSSGKYNIPFTAGTVAAGKTEHSKTLFNLGTSYKVTPNSQVFANFSQGFTIVDLQRALRDVRSGYKVNSDNIEPVTVDSYELGWAGNFNNTKAKLSGFYNTSDKTVHFTKDYLVEVVDTDERIYGAEAAISHDLNDEWTLGTTIAYTSGQYKDSNGTWRELSPVRISPLKATAYAQYNFPHGSSIRLQALAIDGTDKAAKDAKDTPDLNVQPVTGYVVADLVGQVNLPKGHLDYGIYNIGNTQYKTVYHQTTYGAMNRLDATGTTYGLSYTLEY